MTAYWDVLMTSVVSPPLFDLYRLNHLSGQLPLGTLREFIGQSSAERVGLALAQ
ncbi:Uncharacterised protein [Mycobacterium tuberculosis]|nr:Uncharacterised protein [Mycobacterium tuberculosis]